MTGTQLLAQGGHLGHVTEYQCDAQRRSIPIQQGSSPQKDMAPLTIYNVKRGTWHTHTLSKDASVLVVENSETTEDNSPFCPLTPEQTSGIVEDTNRLWEEPEA